MATSSHYGPTVSRQRPHYDGFLNAHAHLYAGLASWHTPYNFPYGSVASSSQLVRPSPAAQQPLPANHNYQAASPVDYVNHGPVQSTWPANFLRPGWGNALDDESHTLRTSTNYADAGYGMSAPHPGPTGHNALMRGHNLHLHLNRADNLFATSPQGTPIPSLFSTAPNASPLPSAPLSGLLNYPLQSSPTPQPQAQQTPVQMGINWPAGPSSDVPPSSQNHALNNNASIALSTGVTAPSVDSLSSSPWSLLNGPPSASTTPVFDRISDADADWVLLEGSSTSGAPSHHSSHSADFPIMNHPQPIPLSLVAPREERRQASSKKKVVKIASSFTERAPKTKTSRRTGKMAEHKRTNAAKMRKKGTCIRCKFYSIGCDDGDPCRRCINIKDTARVFRGPCTRFRMDSLSLVRHCNGRFSQSEAFFLSYSWKDRLNPPHDMEIMWHLPGSRSKLITSPIPIKYREYHPEELKGLDPTSSHWQNTAGTVRRVVQPPYAVSDTSSLVANVERYILESQPAIEAWIFDHARGNDLKLLTYAEAVRVRNEGNGLLRVALQMQCAAIVSQGYGTVWSPNIPGIRTYDYRQLGPCTYEAYNRDGPDRPLPQAIGHQMDVAILKYCGRLEKDLLKRLNETIFHKGIKPWYELYLTLFVMLSNLEYLHGGAERYIMSKRRTMLESQVDYVVRSQTEHWEYTAPLLHYLYQCILRGHVPLKMALENPEELRMQDGMLDDLGFRYFTRVATLLGENGRYPRMVSKLESSENPASKWIPQLFKDMIEPAPAQRA